MTALERHLRKWMEKAVQDFGLIAPGDRVCVAVSGGKDSLALLHLLQGPLVDVTRDFSLTAVHVDAGIPRSDASQLESHFKSLGGDFVIVPARHIFEAATAPDNKKRPCFLCARLRRRILFETAHERGCNAIALAHHRDDVMETLLMNMFYNREISAMVPGQEMFDGGLRMIRPLYYIRERLIARFAAQARLPVLKAQCPAEDHTRRKFVKDALAHMESVDPTAANNLFRSMFRIYGDYMPKPPPGGLKLPRDF
jgi:tRNA 2-thiocytidine biosynthesis protein TtcA